MDTIKVNIDTVQFTSKPKGFAVGSIRNRLYSLERVEEITPEALAQRICQGVTWTQAVMAGTTKKDWREQWTICADLDNKGESKLSPEECVELLHGRGIRPFFLYPTFSDSEGCRKYRVVICLHNPILDMVAAEQLGQRLARMINTACPGAADEAVAEGSRLFYGSHGVPQIFGDWMTSDELDNALPLIQLVSKPVEYIPEHRPIEGGTLDELNKRFNRARNDFDLKDYIMKTTGAAEHRRGSHTFLNPSPLSGHNDDFEIIGRSQWAEYSTSTDNLQSHYDGQKGGGGLVEYLMQRDGLSKQDALDKARYDVLGFDREEYKKAWQKDKDEKLDANMQEATKRAIEHRRENFPLEHVERPADAYNLEQMQTAGAHAVVLTSTRAGADIIMNADKHTFAVGVGAADPEQLCLWILANCDVVPPIIVGYDQAPDCMTAAGVMHYQLLKHGISHIVADLYAPAVSPADAEEQGVDLAGKVWDAIADLFAEERKTGADRLRIAEIAQVADDQAGLTVRQAVELTPPEKTIETAAGAMPANQTTEDYYNRFRASDKIEPLKTKIAGGKNNAVIGTGFANLDRLLDGGLYPGLYILGAVPSSGKTSVCLQMADQIAAQGQDVLFFSLEMSADEIMARSVSRESYNYMRQTKSKCKAKSARDILSGPRYANYSDGDLEMIAAAWSRYGTYSDHVFIVEGLGTVSAAAIRTSVQEHIKQTGNKPICFIDYLQIVAPKDPKQSDKRNTDDAVLAMKQLSRDFDLTVFLISSFNRENYSNEVGMQAFKESGAIEYGADVLMGLSLYGTGTKGFDLEDAKKRNPRDIELKILKQRLGPAGGICRFDYYPRENKFVPTL